MALSACKVETIIDSTDTTGFPRFPGCSLDTDFMVSAAARDAIRPLDDPAWVRAHESVPEYLDAGTRPRDASCRYAAFLQGRRDRRAVEAG
jgi:hypothetical protein